VTHIDVALSFCLLFCVVSTTTWYVVTAHPGKYSRHFSDATHVRADVRIEVWKISMQCLLRPVALLVIFSYYSFVSFNTEPHLNQYLEGIMPTVATQGKTPAHRYDPLGPLADAIGSMTGTVSEKVASALHQVLEATTPQSRNARLQLIRHLVDVESQSVGIEMPRPVATANDLISTAQAAELLGYSRPYVAMLIDQNKLKGATVSAGGHRRVSRASVLDWKAKHQVTGKAADLRTEGQKTGVYKSAEADVLRRVKALAKNR
jgi:excisionase family DNA binding protein